VIDPREALASGLESLRHHGQFVIQAFAVTVLGGHLGIAAVPIRSTSDPYSQDSP
jgi:hypothetical protein